MATADVATQPQDEPEVKSESTAPGLAWDASVTARPIGLGWDSEPVVIDWDGPGRSGLLVVSGGGPSGRSTRLYRAVSPPGEYPPRFDSGRPIAGLDGLRCLCPLPSDKPGRFDLVGLAEEGLVLLRDQSSEGEPRFETRESLGIGPDLGAGPCRVAQLIAIDWDGDGLTDLLVGLDDLNEYWPDPIPVEQQVGFNRMGGHPGYDARGVWRGRAPQGRIRWLKNVGPTGSPRFELQPEIESEAGRVELDLNPAALAVSWGGGSAVELTISDRQGQIRLFRNFGGQRPPVLMEPRALRSEGKPLVLPDDRTILTSGDIDGDRRVEFLFGTADGRVLAIHAAPGRDSAQPPVVLMGEPTEFAVGGHAVVSAGDLDADGGLDLVVGDPTGRLSWLKDVGQGDDHRYLAPVAIDSGGEPFRLDPGPDGRLMGPVAPRLGYASPCITDWNKNGRPDILLGGAGGELLLLRNDGSRTDPRFASPVQMLCGGAPLITPSRVRPAAASWTNPEKLDLIALDLQGFLCVYPGDGTHVVEPAIRLVDVLGRELRLDGGFGQNGRVALWAGEWTGSGRPDILVGIGREARYLVPAITGKSMPIDAISTVLLLENHGKNTLVPRQIRHADGSPIVIGAEGCSPSGVTTQSGRVDLIVGSDDGRVHYFHRDSLRW